MSHAWSGDLLASGVPHPSGSGRAWAWGLWAALLMALATLGLTELIVPGRWLVRLIGLLVAVALVGCGLRFASRSLARGAQAVIVAAVTLIVMGTATLHEAAPSAMVWRILPTWRAWRLTAGSVVAAIPQIAVVVPPAPDAAMFAPLAFGGLGLLAALVVPAAVVWRSPVAVLLGGLAPWGLILAMHTETGPLRPLVSAAAALAFLVWRAGGLARPAGGRVLAGMFVTVFALVLGVAALTVAPGLPGWGQGRAWYRAVTGGGGAPLSIGVGGAVDVNGSLQAGDSTPRLRVSGDYAGPLLMETLTDFDGFEWAPSAGHDALVFGVDVGVGDSPWSDAAPFLSQLYPVIQTTSVQLLSPNNGRVPLPTGPREIAGLYSPEGSFDTLRYFPPTDTLQATTAFVSGQSINYDVHILDRGTLRGDAAAPPPDDPLARRELAVPATSHAAQLRVLTDQLVAGQTTDYDKLMAIQDYLASDVFRYTLTPSLGRTSDDAVWDFLQRRTGYCVQFASAMVVLGRLAGIPMRAAVGYVLPAGGTGDITDQQAHMWAQAHFAGAGWVDFDPTPATHGGAVPSSSASSPTPTSSTPGQTPTGAATPTAGASASSSAPSPSMTPSGSGTAVTVPWRGMLAGAGIAAAGVLALLGRGLYRARWTPERAWAGIVRVGRRRRLLTAGATPRAVVTALEPLLDAEAGRQLMDLAVRLERDRYAPSRPEASPPSRHWHDVQSSIVRCLRGGRHAA